VEADLQRRRESTFQHKRRRKVIVQLRAFGHREQKSAKFERVGTRGIEGAFCPEFGWTKGWMTTASAVWLAGSSKRKRCDRNSEKYEVRTKVPHHRLAFRKKPRVAFLLRLTRPAAWQKNQRSMSPTIAAESRLAIVPVIMARIPRRASSDFLLRASAPMPPIWMPMELKFAKPQSAKVAMVNERGARMECLVPWHANHHAAGREPAMNSGKATVGQVDQGNKGNQHSGHVESEVKAIDACSV
jgi:hypothetical protein